VFGKKSAFNAIYYYYPRRHSPVYRWHTTCLSIELITFVFIVYMPFRGLTPKSALPEFRKGFFCYAVFKPIVKRWFVV